MNPRYSIVIFKPDMFRLDTIAVGIAVQWNGALKVFSRDNPLVGAVGGATASDSLPHQFTDLNDLAERSKELGKLREEAERIGLGLSLHSFEGQFYADSEDEFGKKVQHLLDSQVAKRVLAKPATVARKKPNQANKILKTGFDNRHLLSSKRELDHMVVRNFQVDAIFPVRVDYALKNASYHFIETLDLDGSYSDQVKTKAAQASCFVLDTARRNHQGRIETYAVFTPPDSENHTPLIDLLGAHAQLFAVTSGDDMRRFWGKIDQATT